MSDVTIRPSMPHDLPAIQALLPKQRLDVLRWMLGGPTSDYPLHSFVATVDDAIAGHVGYTRSRFAVGEGHAVGVHVVNWAVDDAFRGRGIGQRLFEATFAEGDFSYHFTGTPAAERIYPALGFAQGFPVYTLIKVLSPRRYRASLSGGGVRDTVKVIALSARALLAAPVLGRYRGTRLEPYTARPGRGVGTRCVANIEPPETITWLAACPIMDSASFDICRDGGRQGVAVCYIKTLPGDIRLGRLAHISYLGDEPAAWLPALREVEAFLRRQGCATVSTYASHPAFVKALRRAGYVTRERTPIWVRDPRGLLPSTPWHVTGLEGDVGYRHL